MRKEFILRWIVKDIDVAFEIDHFESVSDAFYHLEQAFGIRDVKATIRSIATCLEQKGAMDNTRLMAIEFVRNAAYRLRRFDRILKRRTANRCGCVIGSRPLRIDYNAPFECLREFLTSVDVVEDCPVNEFLGLGKSSGRAPRLLEIDDVRNRTRSGEKLKSLHDRNQWITCTQCKSIGDAVIALDQPKTHVLVHIDEDFKILCRAVQKPHQLILSERAVEREARET